MKRLQNKIKAFRSKLYEIRFDLFFQSLPKEEQEIYWEAMKKLNDFEDAIIINHIIKK